jgi:TonB family protein
MRARAGVIILSVLPSMLAATAHAHQAQNTPPDSKASAATPKPKASNVVEAKLIHKVPPVYPPDAKKAGVSGTVVIHAVIAKDGSVQKAQYVSGPEPLRQSALDAVAQWHYTPTTLNGQPMDVETDISVVYSLDATPPSAAEEAAAIDPQYKADVMHLLETTHYRESAVKAAKDGFDSSRPRLQSSFPDTPNRDKIIDAFATRMEELIQSQEFIDRIVVAYHKYLSDDEVKTLTQFYATPAGQHFASVEVEMVTDLAKAGNQVARDGLPKVFKSLCTDYPELQGKAKFCPAAPGDAPEAPPTLKPTPAPAPPPTNP